MSLQEIVINLPSQTAQDFKDMCNLAPGSNQAVINLSNFLRRLAGGESYGTTTVNVGAIQSSGTITFSSTGPTNNQTCTIAGVTFTAKTSGATGNQFNINASATVVATNLAAAINASSSLSGIVTASSLLGVVTVTAVTPGVSSNGLVMANVDLSNAVFVTFAGGSNGTQYVIDLS